MNTLRAIFAIGRLRLHPQVVYHFAWRLTKSTSASRSDKMPEEPIAVGQPAPDFSLAASNGPSPLRLADLRGKLVVLAFYPQDFTET